MTDESQPQWGPGTIPAVCNAISGVLADMHIELGQIAGDR
jgi:hypothetical protein